MLLCKLQHNLFSETLQKYNIVGNTNLFMSRINFIRQAYVFSSANLCTIHNVRRERVKKTATVVLLYREYNKHNNDLRSLKNSL